MLHKKGMIYFLCNALYSAQAIQWGKCNLIGLSTYFTFEDFSWMLPRATENTVVGHMRPAGL